MSERRVLISVNAKDHAPQMSPLQPSAPALNGKEILVDVTLYCKMGSRRKLFAQIKIFTSKSFHFT